MPSPAQSRPLSQWITPKVLFAVGGRGWPLLFTHRALLVCQELTGVDMLQATVWEPSARFMRSLIWSAISVAGSTATEKQVGAVVARLGIHKTQKLLYDAWIVCMPVPEKVDPADADEDPDPSDPSDPSDPDSDDGAHKLSWVNAWADAHYNLRLSSDEWLDSTPRQIQILRRTRIESIQREELMMGILIATVENFSMSAPKTPAKPEQFMLHKFKGRKKSSSPVTGEYIMSRLQTAGWSKANVHLKQIEPILDRIQKQ